MGSKMASINFIVIQENSADAAHIQDLLKQSGAQTVRCFSDLKGGAQLLRTAAAGLIISDLESTPVDGKTFATMLRGPKMAINNSTPLLLTAKDATGQLAQEALSAGANSIIAKPLNQAELIKHLGLCFKAVA